MVEGGDRVFCLFPLAAKEEEEAKRWAWKIFHVRRWTCWRGTRAQCWRRGSTGTAITAWAAAKTALYASGIPTVASISRPINPTAAKSAMSTSPRTPSLSLTHILYFIQSSFCYSYAYRTSNLEEIFIVPMQFWIHNAMHVNLGLGLFNCHGMLSGQHHFVLIIIHLHVDLLQRQLQVDFVWWRSTDLLLGCSHRPCHSKISRPWWWGILIFFFFWVV